MKKVLIPLAIFFAVVGFLVYQGGGIDIPWDKIKDFALNAGAFVFLAALIGGIFGLCFQSWRAFFVGFGVSGILLIVFIVAPGAYEMANPLPTPLPQIDFCSQFRGIFNLDSSFTCMEPARVEEIIRANTEEYYLPDGSQSKCVEDQLNALNSSGGYPDLNVGAFQQVRMACIEGLAQSRLTRLEVSTESSLAMMEAMIFLSLILIGLNLLLGILTQKLKWIGFALQMIIGPVFAIIIFLGGTKGGIDIPILGLMPYPDSQEAWMIFSMATGMAILVLFIIPKVLGIFTWFNNLAAEFLPAMITWIISSLLQAAAFIAMFLVFQASVVGVSYVADHPAFTLTQVANLTMLGIFCGFEISQIFAFLFSFEGLFHIVDMILGDQ